jgi:nitrite reductase/ring-hydroxylating ferredoxin subunit
MCTRKTAHFSLRDGAVLEPKKLRWPQALAVQPLQARGSSYWSFTQIWQATPCAPA